MLNEEQIKTIKKQLISQIENMQASDEQKEEAKEQIEEMPAEELEKFLNKNKHANANEKPQEECVFCLIKDKKIPSFKVDEDEKSIAVLEINPLSKGHTIIIPKEHIKTDKINKDHIEFAKKVANKIGEKLSPKEIKVSNSEAFGHAILNIIPIYDEIPKERKKADEKELKEVHDKLTAKIKITEESLVSEKPIEKQIETPVEKKSEQPKKLEKAPRRFP